jgi:hypothetical protein
LARLVAFPAVLSFPLYGEHPLGTADGILCGDDVGGVRFVQEQMAGPSAVRLVPDVTLEPMPQERMPQHPVTEIPVDDDQARRSVLASYMKLALFAALMLSLPLIGMWSFMSAEHAIPAWLILTTMIVVVLVVTGVLHSLRFLVSFQRLATAAGWIGLGVSGEGLFCSVRVLGGQHLATLVREGRTGRLLPWSDITGFETRQVNEHGMVRWFLAVHVKSTSEAYMVRFNSLAAPQGLIMEAIHQASGMVNAAADRAASGGTG